MARKVLIPLFEAEVAPRFDLAIEVLTAKCDAAGNLYQEKMLILPAPSAERLCHLIITEEMSSVICGGIEEEYYDYLVWKKIEVIDNVIGASRTALQRYSRGELKSGDILIDSAERS